MKPLKLAAALVAGIAGILAGLYGLFGLAVVAGDAVSCIQQPTARRGVSP